MLEMLIRLSIAEESDNELDKPQESTIKKEIHQLYKR